MKATYGYLKPSPLTVPHIAPMRAISPGACSSSTPVGIELVLSVPLKSFVLTAVFVSREIIPGRDEAENGGEGGPLREESLGSARTPGDVAVLAEGMGSTEIGADMARSS